MNKIASLSLALCLAMASCQEGVENLQPEQSESTTLKIQLPDTFRTISYQLSYQLRMSEPQGRSGSVCSGSAAISKDGTVTIPVSSGHVSGGSLIVTEQGQSSYVLNDLDDITVDYTVGTQSYIGQLTWQDYIESAGTDTPLPPSPVKGKLQIVTDTEDFEAAICSGIDAGTLQSEAYLQTDGQGYVVPNSRTAGDTIQLDGQPMTLLYENEVILYEKSLQHVKLRLKDGDGYQYDFPLNNLPMSPGHTTVVAGVSLTSDIRFNVTINSNFDGEHQKDTE